MPPGNEWKIRYVWEDVIYTMIELDVGYEESIQKEDPELKKNMAMICRRGGWRTWIFFKKI